MPTYVAFLRAINLGAHRQFGKVQVAAVTEAAGFTGVATHLNTGNVKVVTAMRSVARVEVALETAYAADRGFDVPVVALTQDELRRVAADAEELGQGHEGSRFVAFLKQVPAAGAVTALEARCGEGERVVVRERAVHVLVASLAHPSRLSSAVERHLGVATSRNVRVVTAAAEMWC